MSESLEGTLFPPYWDELIFSMKRFKNMDYLDGGTSEERIVYLQEEITRLQKNIEEAKQAELTEQEEIEKSATEHGIKATFHTPSPAVFYPKLCGYLVERIMPNLELKPLLQDFFIRVGTTCAIPKQKDAKATAVIGRAASGDSIFMDFTPYELATVTPFNTGLRVRLTREVLEDGIVNIVEDDLRQAAKRIVLSIEGDIANLFDYSTKKTHTWFPGRGYPHIGDVLTDLHDTAERYVVITNDKVSQPFTEFRTVRSSSIPKNVAYVIQTVFEGCYAPLGYWITKRPISVDVWPQRAFDSIDVVITVRYAPLLVYPEAITRCRV